MSSDNPLVLAVPSKGRLMDKTIEVFASAGLTIEKTGHERGYRGRIAEAEQVEVAFLSASEIAHNLKEGAVHLGVTGEDLLRENILDADARVEFVYELGFGHADIVVAVPEAWLDVNTTVDLEDAASQFHARHNRRLRVATKYINVTRGFFARMGVSGYRIVESLGATEGAPAAGTAEVIVDITSTGSTLKANNLKILNDGVILKSQANLAASRAASWNQAASDAKAMIVGRLGAVLD